MSSEVIPPTQVSSAKIKEIFDNALLSATFNDQGDVLVAEGGIKVLVSVDTDRQLLNFLLLFGYRRGASEKDKIELANELNKNMVFLRAWSFGNGMVFDYVLPYDTGLLSKQVISAYRWLRKTTLAGIQQHDQKNIIA